MAASPPRLGGRWPTLDLPWVGLGSFPTPVEPLEALSAELGAEVWLKRDDLTGARYGGNKVRKLEFLLGRARREGRQAVVTTGAYGSHHCLATATYGAALGLDVHLVLSPQALTPHVLDDLLLQFEAGATQHRTRRPAANPTLAEQVAARLPRAAIIPNGGSDAYGALGYVEAGLELADQVAQGELPAPDAIFVAAGTCGTMAGLALGLELGGLATRVVGVRVVPPLLTNMAVVERLRASCARLLASAGLPASARGAAEVALELDPAELGPGYGLETPAGAEARVTFARAGVTLEETYTGKAAAALLRHARGPGRGQRLLFWLTFSSVDLSQRLARVDPAALPREFHPVLREGGRL